MTVETDYMRLQFLKDI